MKLFKKAVSVALIILLSSYLFVPVGAEVISVENYDLKIPDFSYPITPESDSWGDYTVLEKVRMLAIPEERLSVMSDEELVSAVASYPFLVDIYLYGDSVSDGINVARSYFSALDELLSRNSGLSSLYAYGVQPAQLLLAKTSSQISEDDHFVSKALIDIYNASISSKAIDSNNSVNASYTTPNGTPLAVSYYTEVHTQEEHRQLDINQIVNVYAVTLLTPGSCLYNCHFYAWYMRGSSLYVNYAWLNNPSAYMTDGSYNLVYQGSPNNSTYTANINYNDIIFYGSLSGSMNTWHSAIYRGTTGSGAPLASQPCVSKWGDYGVFQHAIANVPAGYDSSIISAWRMA